MTISIKSFLHCGQNLLALYFNAKKSLTRCQFKRKLFQTISGILQIGQRNYHISVFCVRYTFKTCNILYFYQKLVIKSLLLFLVAIPKEKNIAYLRSAFQTKDVNVIFLLSNQQYRLLFKNVLVLFDIRR